VRKIAFQLPPPPCETPSEVTVTLGLYSPSQPENEGLLDTQPLKLAVRAPGERHKHTFVSETDGSVQYYAVVPADPHEAAPGLPALVLTLHGAGVEATGQAAAYLQKTWAHIVAPTNRRPFGFDWEDWGRLDALEALADAERTLHIDPQRIYLTGHSMGGHGTWQIGAHYPDRFAAIAPSAGWTSFWSYGAERPEPNTPIEILLYRATNPSDTVTLARNCLHYGIYVLHGEQDDNVPVEHARKMRAELAAYHPNFAYYERPGAGHWWGNECVDWPPLFAFLRQNTRPPAHTVQHIAFVTANPAISATSDWATIEAQVRSLDFSRVDLQVEKKDRLVRGTTENVTRLAIAAPLDPGQPLAIELDGDRLTDIPWPGQNLLYLEQHDGHWQIMPEAANPRAKSPRRGGPFKEIFRHHVQLVYGTHGNPAENAWAWAKTRYDAEVFWVRGNGTLEIVPDDEFNPTAEPDRSVILYGNADTNAAWKTLFADAPLQIARGVAEIGARRIEGDDLAVLACYPRPGSERALVGVVSGTGLAGLRLTERLPYFVSGVAYPDWIAIGTDMLQSGTNGVRGAGFFNNDWQIDPEQSAWAVP
jgi:dienelactone hydrolase